MCSWFLTARHRTSNLHVKAISDLTGCPLTQFLRQKSGVGLRMFRHKFWADRQKLCLQVHCPSHAPSPLTQALRRLELANFLQSSEPETIRVYWIWFHLRKRAESWPFCVINLNSSLWYYLRKLCSCLELRTVAWDIQCSSLQGKMRE